MGTDEALEVAKAGLLIKNAFPTQFMNLIFLSRGPHGYTVSYIQIMLYE